MLKSNDARPEIEFNYVVLNKNQSAETIKVTNLFQSPCPVFQILYSPT